MFHALSADELNSALSSIPGWNGVHLRESLPEPRGLCGVINLDDESPGGGAARGGTHWVAWYGDSYFDSYGCPPIAEITGIKKYSTIVIQDIKDINCGYYCGAFIRLMDKHKGNFGKVIGLLDTCTDDQLIAWLYGK